MHTIDITHVHASYQNKTKGDITHMKEPYHMKKSNITHMQESCHMKKGGILVALVAACCTLRQYVAVRLDHTRDHT